jgi:hypothetical protein
MEVLPKSTQREMNLLSGVLLLVSLPALQFDPRPFVEPMFAVKSAALWYRTTLDGKKVIGRL